MTLYCATHKDEDLNALQGERLDAMTDHMVKHKAYSLDAMSGISANYVVWEMVRKADGHYYFHRVDGR